MAKKERKIDLDEKSKELVEKFSKIREIDDINIENNIYSDGSVEINANTNVKEFYGSDKSSLKISKGIKLKADKFSHKGKLEVEDGNNSIIANKLDIDNAHIMQPFLTVEKISKDNFKIINFRQDNQEFYNYLYKLDKTDKRNLPSYITNLKGYSDGFFEEYVDGDISSVEAKMPNFAKYTASSKEQAVSEIFSDIHPTILTKLLENNRYVVKEIVSQIDNDIKDTNILFSNYTNFNINHDNISSILNDRLIANTFVFSKNILDKFNMSLIGGKYTSNQEFKSNGKYISDSYILGMNINKDIFNTTLSYTHTQNTGTRTMQENDIVDASSKSNIFSVLTNANINLFKKDNIELNTNLGYRLDIAKVYDFKEKSSKSEQYINKIEDTVLFKNSINLGLNSKINFDKLSVLNDLDVDINLNTENKLNSKLKDIEYKLKGKDLSRYILKYQFGIKYDINDNFSITTKAYVNNDKKMGSILNIKIDGDEMDKLEDILNAYIDVEKFSEGDLPKPTKEISESKENWYEFFKSELEKVKKKVLIYT